MIFFGTRRCGSGAKNLAIWRVCSKLVTLRPLRCCVHTPGLYDLIIGPYWRVSLSIEF